MYVYISRKAELCDEVAMHTELKKINVMHWTLKIPKFTLCLNSRNSLEVEHWRGESIRLMLEILKIQFKN